MRTTLYAALALALIPACVLDEPIDELADESELDGEAGKGDTVDAFTYFLVHSINEQCALGGSECDAYRVKRLNRTSTNCGGGEISDYCFVDTLDFSRTKLASVDDHRARIMRNESSYLLRGELDTSKLDAPTLYETEVWDPGTTTGVIDGVGVLLRDNGVRCVTAPCPSITETRINANARQASLTAFDLTRAGATAAAIADAADAVHGAGMILVGDRYYPDGGKGRRARFFWTRAAD